MEPKTIIKLLTKSSLAALEGAVLECVTRRHHEVRLEHWLLALTRAPASDLGAVLQYDGSASRLARILERRLDAFRAGNAGKPVFSFQMLQCFADAWTGIAEPRGDKRIRSGVVVAQLVAAPQRYEQEQLAHELQSFEAGIATPTAETLAALPEAAEAEVAPVPTVPRLPRESVDHVVATGEDLLAIARRYAVDVEDLARKNGLGIHDALEPGSTVTVSAMPRDVVPR